MSFTNHRPMPVRRVLATAIIAAVAGLGLGGAVEAQNFGFATFSATLNKDGSTARGSGVQSSTRKGAGYYNIVFTRNVKLCAFAATPRGTKAAQVAVQPVSGKAKHVEVRTFNAAGAATDFGFTLVLNCSP